VYFKVVMTSFFLMFSFNTAVFAKNQCIQFFQQSKLVFSTSQKILNGQSFLLHQIQGRMRKIVLAQDLAPEIPDSKKIIVGFDQGHVYIYHDGKKANSWGKPPFQVHAIPENDSRLNGQMFLVLHDLHGDLSARFAKVFNDFEGQYDRTCIRLMCTFMKDLYPQENISKQLNTQMLFYKLLQWQSSETYSAQVFVTDRSSLELALHAQWTNQVKTIRNLAAKINIPEKFIFKMAEVLFGIEGL
jgi:hypothetical protein